jgi:hypothetical protein
MYTGIQVSSYSCIHVCRDTGMLVFMYPCMQGYGYPCIHVSMYPHIQVSSYSCIHVFMSKGLACHNSKAGYLIISDDVAWEDFYTHMKIKACKGASASEC